jgi:hypothetical protein
VLTGEDSGRNGHRVRWVGPGVQGFDPSTAAVIHGGLKVGRTHIHTHTHTHTLTHARARTHTHLVVHMHAHIATLTPFTVRYSARKIALDLDRHYPFNPLRIAHAPDPHSSNAPASPRTCRYPLVPSVSTAIMDRQGTSSTVGSSRGKPGCVGGKCVSSRTSTASPKSCTTTTATATRCARCTKRDVHGLRQCSCGGKLQR